MPYVVFQDDKSTQEQGGSAPETSKTLLNKPGTVLAEKPDLVGPVATLAQVHPENVPAAGYPIVKLDVDEIKDDVAARLATSLLGHVLFLKGQIPLPVLQLARIPANKGMPRAVKSRIELLNSFDTIASHLDTTFSALSTAFAKATDKKTVPYPKSRAYMAILVGPSMGTSKAKVVFGVDGLETRIWGEQLEPKSKPEATEALGDDAASDDDAPDQEGGDDDDDGSGESDADEPEASDEEEDDDGEDDGPSASSEEGEDEEDEESDSEDDPSSQSQQPPNPDPPYISHAEQQKFLQNADRLLSRTLATADADGQGISSEISPTQTYVLIRAPRTFDHPAWIPRQNLTPSLDGALQEFLQASGCAPANLTKSNSSSERRPTQKKTLKKAAVEGVWITCRQGLTLGSTGIADEGAVVSPARDGHVDGDVDGKDKTEDEDMVWWSWDGKLAGFSDW